MRRAEPPEVTAREDERIDAVLRRAVARRMVDFAADCGARQCERDIAAHRRARRQREGGAVQRAARQRGGGAAVQRVAARDQQLCADSAARNGQRGVADDAVPCCRRARMIAAARNHAPGAALDRQAGGAPQRLCADVGAARDGGVLLHAPARRDAAYKPLAEDERIALGGDIGRIVADENRQIIHARRPREAHAAVQPQKRAARARKVDAAVHRRDANLACRGRQGAGAGDRQRSAEHDLAARRRGDCRRKVAERRERRRAVALAAVAHEDGGRVRINHLGTVRAHGVRRHSEAAEAAHRKSVARRFCRSGAAVHLAAEDRDAAPAAV